MRLLSYDSPFMTGFRRLVDYILLGLLWVAVSLPLVTFGAATASAIHTAEKAVRREEGKLLSTFFACFCREFRQGTLLTLLYGVMLALLVIDVLVVTGVKLPWAALLLLALVMLLVFSWMQLWFGYLSCFQDTSKALLSNTFRMTLDSTPKVLLLALTALAALAVSVLCVVWMAPYALLVPGIYLMLSGRLLRWIFGKYTANIAGGYS